MAKKRPPAQELDVGSSVSSLARMLSKTVVSAEEEEPVVKTKKSSKKTKAKAKKGNMSILPATEVLRTQSEQRKAVEAIKAEINKKYKSEVIILGSEIKPIDSGRLPIGNFSLDVATGGGIFIGGIISVSGAFSTGKTLNGLKFVAECQKKGLICLWVAVEPFDPEWAMQVGVDVDLLLVHEPSGAEEGLQVAVDCQWRDDVDVVIIDSVEALEPTKEREKEMDDTMQMAIKPKIIGEYLRKFRALNNLRKRKARKNSDVRPMTLFLINQLREKPTMFGD